MDDGTTLSLRYIFALSLGICLPLLFLVVYPTAGYRRKLEDKTIDLSTDRWWALGRFLETHASAAVVFEAYFIDLSILNALRTLGSITIALVAAFLLYGYTVAVERVELVVILNLAAIFVAAMLHHRRGKLDQVITS